MHRKRHLHPEKHISQATQNQIEQSLQIITQIKMQLNSNHLQELLGKDFIGPLCLDKACSFLAYRLLFF